MTKDGHVFLDALAEFPPRTFESNFSRISRRLGLGRLLSGTELNSLFQASFKAALCKIAFNGLGGCGGMIKPASTPKVGARKKSPLSNLLIYMRTRICRFEIARHYLSCGSFSVMPVSITRFAASPTRSQSAAAQPRSMKRTSFRSPQTPISQQRTRR